MNESSGYSVEDNFNVQKSVVEAAREHFNSGNFKMAAQLYKSLLNTDASSKLYNDLGLCYYKLQDYDSAIEQFSNSINLDDSNSVAYSYKGNCYFKKLDANNAIESWIYSRRISPKDEFVCLNLAISYFAKNMFYESVFYYDKYLKYAQNKTKAQYKSILKNVNEMLLSANEYYISAQNNLRRNEFSLAEQNLLSAIKKYPINSEYSYTLANLYYDKKDYFNAVVYYELTLRDSSIAKKEIYQRMAISYENLNNYRLAYCYYKRYQRFVLSDQQAYFDVVRKLSHIKSLMDISNSEVTLEMAGMSYKNNEYFKSLLEYENYSLLDVENSSKVEDNIKNLKQLLDPEQIIVRSYLKKAKELILRGERSGANKYLTEVLALSNPKSDEYRLAKSKITNG